MYEMPDGAIRVVQVPLKGRRYVGEEGQRHLDSPVSDAQLAQAVRDAIAGVL